MGKAVTNHKLLAALELAVVLEMNPEMIVDGHNAKEHIKVLAKALNASTCYRNAQLKGRQTFCLTSDDSLAPEIIEIWAQRCHLHGVADGKIGGALKMAHEWRQNPDARLPD